MNLKSIPNTKQFFSNTLKQNNILLEKEVTDLPTAKPNHTSCMGYDVFEKSLEHLCLSKKTLITTINQYSYCIAKKDIAFKKALTESDILLPDGIGIVKAAKFIEGKTIKKIAGADIHDYLLKKVNQEHGSCFYLGASKSTLEKIEKRINKEYKNISVATYSPPFKATFDTKDIAEMIEAVNKFNPDVLFVGMTAPKQEKWSHKYNDELNAKIICPIGAVFDFYAGTVSSPNQFWIDMNLEWLGRLIREPRRMWKRYIYYGIIFLGYLIKEKFYFVIKKRS